MKKKIIAASMIAALSVTSVTPALAQETTITPTASVQKSNVNDVYTQYLDILQRYKIAQDNGFYQYPYPNGGSLLQQLDVNPILAASATDTLDYALVDLTQDGTPELFIASHDYSIPVLPYNMYDIFSVVNGNIVRPIDDFSMGYRSWYTITENGYLDNLKFSGAKDEIHQYLTIDPLTGTPVYDKWIEYESWTNDQYYMNYGKEDYDNKFVITKAEYDAIRAQYSMKQDIVWHPISDFSSLWTELNNNNIPVYINGLQIDFDQQPVNENGRVLVPMRGVFEALGAEVYWDNASRSIISSRGDINLIMTIDSDIMYKNGVAQYVDVPPKIINDRTMVPLRVIGEAFGCNVLWENNAVYISTQ